MREASPSSRLSAWKAPSGTRRASASLPPSLLPVLPPSRPLSLPPSCQADGSFAGDEWGEIDTRFSYCALSTLAIMGRLPRAGEGGREGGREGRGNRVVLNGQFPRGRNMALALVFLLALTPHLFLFSSRPPALPPSRPPALPPCSRRGKSQRLRGLL
jgi:hypothetical protein